MEMTLSVCMGLEVYLICTFSRIYIKFSHCICTVYELLVCDSVFNLVSEYHEVILVLG